MGGAPGPRRRRRHGGAGRVPDHALVRRQVSFRASRGRQAMRRRVPAQRRAGLCGDLCDARCRRSARGAARHDDAGRDRGRQRGLCDAGRHGRGDGARDQGLDLDGSRRRATPHAAGGARPYRRRADGADRARETTMKFTGDIAIDAPPEAVFAKVRDARFFASCVEGVQQLNEIDAEHYTAVLETKVAYLKFKFNVAVEVVRIEPPREIEARIEGTPLGIVGRLTASSVTRLAEDNGGTRVSYEIEAALTCKLGSLGQPVLRAKAKEMERQFAERLRAAFSGATEAAR